MKNKLIGAIAAAAAIAFVTAPVTSSLANAKSSKVACYGVNSCKGKSACKTSSNACKGQNSCKGKGVTKMSAKKCTKKGGSTTAPAATPATPATN
jgi:hypothetical protein